MQIFSIIFLIYKINLLLSFAIRKCPIWECAIAIVLFIIQLLQSLLIRFNINLIIISNRQYFKYIRRWLLYIKSLYDWFSLRFLHFWVYFRYIVFNIQFILVFDNYSIGYLNLLFIGLITLKSGFSFQSSYFTYSLFKLLFLYIIDFRLHIKILLVFLLW